METIRDLPEEERLKLEGVQLGSVRDQERAETAHGILWDLGVNLSPEASPQEIRAWVRDRVKNEIYESREGMNLDVVLNHFEKLRLPVRDFVIVDESQLRKLKEILAAIGQEAQFEENNGGWSPALGLAIILRRRELEDANGSYASRDTLAHELAHGALNPERDEVGKEWGHFFSEGSVQMLAGECSREGLKRGEEPAVAEHWRRFLQLEDGGSMSNLDISDLNIQFKGNSREGKDITIRVSVGDVRFNREGLPYEHAPSVAAYGMRLLCHKIPPLRMELRKSPINLEVVKDLINNESPGLFEELNELRYDVADFARGQEIIIDRFYGSDD